MKLMERSDSARALITEEELTRACSDMNSLAIREPATYAIFLISSPTDKPYQ
jgi:hypothetical protein